MTFVNEYASKDDIQTYHLDELQRTHHLANPELAWTVDREREIFLMYAGYTHGAPRFHFMLSRQGNLTFHWLMFSTDENTQTITWTYQRAFPPDYRTEDEREKWRGILNDLKDALRTYKLSGVRTGKYSNYKNIVFVDFEEGL